MKHLLILIQLVVCSFAFSQTNLKVSVKDIAQRPIAGAIVSCGQTRVLTDVKGFCIVKTAEKCTSIQIHKLGFADTTVLVPKSRPTGDTIYIISYLRFNPSVLPEVNITASTVEELNPLKADFILDYELCGNFLVTVLSNDYVVVSDLYNSVMSHSKPLEGLTGIEKDPFGFTYILTDTKAYLFAADSVDVRIDMNRKEKNALIYSNTYIEQVLDSSTIIRRYGDINQTVTFINKPIDQKKVAQILKTISNEARSNAVKSYAAEAFGLAQYVAELNLNKMTTNTRTEVRLLRDAQNLADMFEKVYALPSYNILRLVNDSLYLFAHDIDSLLVYDKNCRYVRGLRINYHHLKTWDKELIINEEKTKVYAKCSEHSKPVLREIDLFTGQLKSTGTVVEFAFPQKIRIKQNKIYYLSKRRNSVGSTIYTQSLNYDH